MAKPRGGHLLATVLFTDIVDSSRLAAELGDPRWRVLLSRHHAIVRKSLKRYGGREIDNAGDGFFAAFDDQADAIRCACEISDGVRVLGAEVRAGCHAGQAEVVGRKFGGVTVHVGARVMSEAAPGEVLVSSVMKDLVPASGFTFADRGLHTLKGIDGEWRLFAVTAVDGNQRPPPLEPDDAARLRQDMQPPPLIRRRWARVLIPTIALVIAAASVIVIATRPKPIQLQANSVARIDPMTNEIISDIPVAEGAGPAIAVPPDEIWVLSYTDQVISVVDTRTGTAAPPFGAFGGAAPIQGLRSRAGFGFLYAFGQVWVTGPNGEIVRLSPRTKLAAGPIPRVRGLPAGLAADDSRLWVALNGEPRVVALDPKAANRPIVKPPMASRATALLQAPAPYGSRTVQAASPESIWPPIRPSWSTLASS